SFPRPQAGRQPVASLGGTVRGLPLGERHLFKHRPDRWIGNRFHQESPAIDIGPRLIYLRRSQGFVQKIALAAAYLHLAEIERLVLVGGGLNRWHGRVEELGLDRQKRRVRDEAGVCRG